MVVRFISLSDLYLDDETAWHEVMTDSIRDGRHSDVDLPSLADYLSVMARRDRREMESRLTVLFAHILTWTNQPEMRSGSWLATILTQRQYLASLFERRTLRNHAGAKLVACYTRGL